MANTAVAQFPTLPAAAPAAADALAGTTDRYKWHVMLVVVFGSFMSLLDGTVVNVALATLQRVFRQPIDNVQGVATYYVLALGIVVPASGYLADRFGAKRVYATSLVLFTVASALCGLAPSLNALIGFRVLQGLGGGALMPVGSALLFGAFPKGQRGLAMGFFGVPALVAPALGPTVGGWIVQDWGWRPIFYINIPIGIIAVALALAFLVDRRSAAPARFDVPGAVLSVLAFGPLLYGLSHAERLGWTSPETLGLLGLGTAALVAFVVVELRSTHPLLELRLFLRPVYTIASALNSVVVVALQASVFLLPLYLQQVRGLSPLHTGLLLMPQALTGMVSVLVGGWLNDRIGPRYVVLFGLVCTAATAWAFSRIDATTALSTIAWVLAARGLFSLGFVSQPTTVAALSVVDQTELNRATALTNVTRSVFQSLGTAVLAAVLQSAGTPAAGAAATTADVVHGFQVAYTVSFVAAFAAIGLAFFLPTKVGASHGPGHHVRDTDPPPVALTTAVTRA